MSEVCNPKRTHNWMGAVVFVIAFWASQAMAQLTTGTITGTVTDQSGAAVPGANVTVKNVDTGISRTTVTGPTGRYEVPNLPVGQYEVSATSAGFQTSVRSGIQLTVGRIAVVDHSLQVGEVTQAVTVTGEASLVETTTATVSQLVDERKVEDLPLNNRDLTQLTFLQPGVLRVPQRQGQSAFSGMGDKLTVAGARVTQNLYLLDGVANSDFSNNPQGASGSYIGAETVKEFQIITNNYSAEYKSAPGAIISAVTKSGTNTLHGSAFEFLRNDNLDAAKWEDNARGGEKPEFKRNQFGGSLGGPILRDRTFFFGSYEGLRERLNTTDTARVLSADVHKGILPVLDRSGNVTGTKTVTIDPDIKPYLALYPIPGQQFPVVKDFGDGTVQIAGIQRQPTPDDFVAAKFDHQFAGGHFLSGTYNWNDSERSPFDLLGELGATGIASERQTVAVGYTSVVSPTVLNEFNFGFSFSDIGEDIPLTDRDFSSIAFHPKRKLVGQINPDPAESIGYRQGGTSYTQKAFSFKDGLSLTSGNHSYRLGVDIGRFKYKQSSCSRGCNGVWEFRGLENFLTNQPRQFDIFLPGRDSPPRNMSQLFFGAYFQDNYRVTNSLTLNLGLRYEFVTVPDEGDDQISNLVNFFDDNVSVPASIQAKFPDEKFAGTIDTFYTNATLKSFSPRFGFAWAPGSQKFSLRGGFGIFFDHPMLFNIRTALQELPPFTVSGRLRDRDASRAGTPLRMFHTDAAGKFPVEVYQSLLSGRPNIRSMDFHQKNAYIYRWSLTLQRELGDWVLSAGYTGSRALHLWVQTTSNIFRWIGWPQQPTGPKQWADPNIVRPVFINPNFGQMRSQSANANSYFQGLAVGVQRRLSHGLQLQMAYNFSKTIDQGAGVTNNGENLPQGLRGVYFWDMHLTKALSAQDIRNTFVANFSYEFPGQNLTGIAAALGKGWQINGILTLLDGHPLSVFDENDVQEDWIGDNANLRPNLIQGGNNNPVLGGPDKYYDTSQFVPNFCTGNRVCRKGDPDYQPGFFGNLGPNTLTSPGLATFDFSLLKNFRITEGSRIQFRAELFNLFNRPNFGTPDDSPFNPDGNRSSAAGRVDDTSTSARQIQFGLKYTF